MWKMQIIVKVFVAVCTNNMQAPVGLHCCFFSLSQSTNASGLLKEGKSHELMRRNIATLSLGRRITLSTAVLSPEIPQHRIRLRWLPARVASKIVCD